MAIRRHGDAHRHPRRRRRRSACWCPRDGISPLFVTWLRVFRRLGRSSSSTEPLVSSSATSFLDFLKKLRRSNSDVWLGGVCGGLGTYSPVPTWVWRVAFLVLIFCLGTGVAAYLILWICIPAEGTGLPKA